MDKLMVERSGKSVELAVTLAIAPVLALIIFIYRKDKHNREPLSLLIKLFLSGSFMTVPIYLVEKLLSFFDIFNGYLSSLYTSFIVAGAVEEYFKRFVVIRLTYNDRSYDEKLDGIVYCVFSALGFAAVENVLYVVRGMKSVVYMGLARGIFAVPAHMLFGITMGYYLSLSKFSKSEERKRLYLKKSYYIPVILHGIYNFILSSRLLNLLIVFIIFLIYLWKSSMDKLNEYMEDSRIKNKHD
jgi:RsiW-degrading membrane proteinase PrsW (M82 family)